MYVILMRTEHSQFNVVITILFRERSSQRWFMHLIMRGAIPGNERARLLVTFSGFSMFGRDDRNTCI